ncbi:hypothetical protein FRC02_002008 [Tulasnella sp. 418]|nr:hypothetical protein FRC02_002008 [Tulasnella sp. 418]
MADKKPVKFRSKGKATPFMQDLRRLIDVPIRLWKPSSTEGAVRVRSCTITPPLKISLQDMLDRKHLPPLSLTDFEDYLKYEERSPENLFFIQWLRDYTAAYEKAKPEEGTIIRALALSWARAKATFFSEVSPMALNLPDKVHPKTTSPNPDPSTLEGAKRETEHMLRESLNRFIATTAQGNVEPMAMVSAGVFAATSTLLSLAPLLVQILGGTGPKGLRAVAIPLLFMGITVALTTLHGVCFITWLLGDARQKREYEMELLPPSISSPTPQTMSYISSQFAQTATLDHGDPLHRIELGFPDPELLDPLEKALFFYTPYFAIDDNVGKDTTPVKLPRSSNSTEGKNDDDTLKLKTTDLALGSLNYQDLAMPASPGPTLTSPATAVSPSAIPFAAAWSDTDTTRFDSQETNLS